MARTETEALVVSLEARVAQFERNFQKANRTAGRNWQAIEKRSQTSANRLERTFGQATSRVSSQFAAMGKNMAAALGVGLGVSGIALLARSAIQTADAIATASDRAGVAAEDFQELSFAARASRVEMDALTDGLKEMNLRADEFITTGGGPAAEAFARLGLGASELSQKLKDPADLFTDIIGRLQQFDRAAQIRIADEIFGGTGGEQFVQLIERGAEGIDELRREARRLGLVLDNETIRQAQALSVELERMVSVARTNLQSGFLAGFVRDSEGLRAAYADPQFQDALRTFGRFIGESLGFLVRNADTILRVMRALAAVYIGAKVGGAIGGKRGAVVGGAVGAGVAGLAELLRDSAEDVEEAIGRIDSALSSGFSTGLGSAATDPIDKLRKATADAKFELDLLHSDLSDTSKEVARTLRGFGLVDTLTDVVPPEAIAEVEAYASALHDLRNEQAQLAQQQKAAEEAAKNLTKSQEEAQQTIARFGDITASAFEDAVLNGERLRDVVRGLAQDIARLILRQSVTQPLTGAFTSFLGGIFSAKGNAFGGGELVPMARGGVGSGGILKRPTMFPMRSGNVAIGGELADEAILPLTRTRGGDLGVRAVGGGSPMVTFAPTVQINVDRPQVSSQEGADELAKTLGRQLDTVLDNKMADFMRRQMRPGGMLNA